MVKGNRFFIVFASTLLALSYAGCGGKNTAQKPGGARLKMALLRDVRGSVEIQRHGKTDWLPARGAMFLFSQDSVRTKENGEADIVFLEGYHVKLSPLSVVHIRVPRKPVMNEPPDSNPVSDIREDVGRIFVKVKKKLGARFEVATPTSVAGVRGTVFSVKVEENGSTSVSVNEGAVELKPASPAEQTGNTGQTQEQAPVQPLMVGAGQQATMDTQMAQTGAVPAQTQPLSPEEQKEWENAQQWLEQVQTELQKALPEEFQGQHGVGGIPDDVTEGMTEEEKKEWDAAKKELEKEQEKMSGNGNPSQLQQTLPQQSPQLSEEQMKQAEEQANEFLKQSQKAIEGQQGKPSQPSPQVPSNEVAPDEPDM